MGCTSSGYITSDDLAQFFGIAPFSAQTTPTKDKVEEFIQKGAHRIHASMAANGQCDCTLASWATTFLDELNTVAAALQVRNADCGGYFSNDEREFWNRWLADQLQLIREGELDLCGGTGPNYPAWGYAAQSLTPFNEAQIIANDIKRNAA